MWWVKLLLALVEGIVGYLRERQLLTAGEAIAVARINEEVLKRAQIAKEIRDRGDELPDDWLRPGDQGGDK